MRNPATTRSAAPLAAILAVGLCVSVGGCCSSSKPPERPPAEVKAEMVKQERFSKEFEENRMQLISSLHGKTMEGIQGYKPVGSEQAHPSQAASQSAMVDPGTGKVAWRAMGCFNPACPGNGKGGIAITARPFSHIRAGAGGALEIGTPDMRELDIPFPCPVCKSVDYMRAYDSPETEAKRRELEAELQAAYDAYGKAAAKKQPSPKGVRSPKKIMEDLANLPKVFLVPQ